MSARASASTEATAAILGRRSSRSGFRRDPIPEAVLREIISCGLAAPSSKDARPWRFHVVSDQEALAEISAWVESASEASSYVPRDPKTGRPRADWESTVRESAAILRSSATSIFIENLCTFSDGRDVTIEAIQSGRINSLVGYTLEVLGLGAAVQNMWVAAHALGLSGTFMGDILIVEEEVARRLGLERDLVGVLALGYAVSGADINPKQALDPTDPQRVCWHRG